MTELLTIDDLELLDEVMAESIEPVAPPPAIRAKVLSAVKRRRRPLDESIPSAEVSHTVRDGEGQWVSPLAGIRTKKLSEDAKRGTVTVLLDLAPGSLLPAHDHHGAEDSYVIRGSCRIGAVALAQGDFHHIEAGAHHGDVVSDEGCLLLLTVDRDDYYHAA